jgi:hypothetical protein
MGRLTREQRHWRAVRRILRAFLVGVFFVALAFAAEYFKWRWLGIVAIAGLTSSIGYAFWALADVFAVWFIKGIPR